MWWPFRKKKRVEQRFMIGAKEMRCLIRGGQLTFATKTTMVHLILEDIGFATIENIMAGCDDDVPAGWLVESLVVEK